MMALDDLHDEIVAVVRRSWMHWAAMILAIGVLSHTGFLRLPSWSWPVLALFFVVWTCSLAVYEAHGRRENVHDAHVVLFSPWVSWLGVAAAVSMLPRGYNGSFPTVMGLCLVTAMAWLLLFYAGSDILHYYFPRVPRQVCLEEEVDALLGEETLWQERSLLRAYGMEDPPACPRPPVAAAPPMPKVRCVRKRPRSSPTLGVSEPAPVPMNALPAVPTRTVQPDPSPIAAANDDQAAWEQAIDPTQVQRTTEDAELSRRTPPAPVPAPAPAPASAPAPTCSTDLIAPRLVLPADIQDQRVLLMSTRLRAGDLSDAELKQLAPATQQALLEQLRV